MDNKDMKTIKFLKYNKIQLDGVTYRPYCISDLPNNFGCISFGESEGISEWFGYKGFTYLIDNS
jgi:hypothetical protein